MRRLSGGAHAVKSHAMGRCTARLTGQNCAPAVERDCRGDTLVQVLLDDLRQLHRLKRVCTARTRHTRAHNHVSSPTQARAPPY
eukprot:355731-Chlamydomonas_euryale.AAC.3